MRSAADATWEAMARAAIEQNKELKKQIKEHNAEYKHHTDLTNYPDIALPGELPSDGTVGFMEAMAAARAGKRVRNRRSDLPTPWLVWMDRCLRFQAQGTPIAISEEYLDARWEIETEKPPAREFTFQEAVEMMKAGKRMRPKSWGKARSVWLDEHGRMETQWGQSAQLHTVAYLLEPWVEVTGG